MLQKVKKNTIALKSKFDSNETSKISIQRSLYVAEP